MRTRVIILIGFAIFMLCAFTVGAETTTKYYRHVDYDGKHQYKFRYEVKGADTSLVKCYRCTYDEKSRLISWEYLQRGILRIDPLSGFASVRLSYDETSEKHEYLDVKLRPLASPRTGDFAEKIVYDFVKKQYTTYQYDRKGNVLTVDGNGASRYVSNINEKGYALNEFALNQKGDKILLDSLVYEKRWLYDENNLQRELSYYDQKGRLVEANGFATIRYSYDSFDNVIEEKYLGVNKKAAIIPESPSTVKKKYDKYGYDSVTEHLNANGEVFAKTIVLYDRFGNIVSSKLYGADGDLVAVECEMSYSYDEFHNPVHIECKNRDGSISYEVFYKYDERNNNTEIKNVTMLADGRSVSVAKMKYDEDDNEIENVYYDENNDIVLREKVIAFVRRKFNKNGQMTEFTCADKNDKLVISPSIGVAKILFEYDRYGDKISEKYYDASNNEISLEENTPSK